MDGIILFADDAVYTNNFERDFFKSLTEEKSHPVIGVDSLELLEKTASSISTYKAIILDWNFKQKIEEEDEGIELQPLHPDEFLLRSKLFSLIYIYSDEEIENTPIGIRLKEEYGSRIKFRQKNKESAEDEKRLILAEIEEFEEQNPNLKIPFIWSQSINKSVQQIFKQLQAADPNWITELYKTASLDPVMPSVEVIHLFQNLLTEKMIEDEPLNEKITLLGGEDLEVDNAENYAKLIRILYYGKVNPASPLMTGDIIEFEKDSYGIIITPECDIRHVAKNSESSYYELLCFKKADFKKSEFDLQATIKASPIISKSEEFLDKKFTADQKTQLSQLLNTQITTAETKLHIIAFTQTNPKLHLLPCFEFEPNNFSGIAKIDFRTSLKMLLGNAITTDLRIGKINSPYIQELRQRYLAYKGRVGVPGHSQKLRKWLLDKN